MRRILLFALCLALALSGASAFAMTTSNADKLAPYDTTADYDMFTISADHWNPVLVSGKYHGVERVDWAANKSIKSPDIVGLSFYLESPDFFSDTAFKLGAYDASTTPTKENLGSLSRFWSPDWYALLLRTTKAAGGQGDDESIRVPLKVFVSDDLAKSYWVALSGDATNELVCTYPCCGLNFNIDCCAPGEYADLTSHTLKIWFDDPDRAAVYCCPGVPFTLVEAVDGLGKIASADRMTVPFTVARLNDQQNMIRVRVDSNYRDASYAHNPDWSWFDILENGQYSAADLCRGTTETFWPWKQELVCTSDTSRYYWKYAKPSGYAGDADFWKTKDHLELADVRLGETLNLGVWYGGANMWLYTSTNPLCVCEAEDNCWNYNEVAIPRINIQNLGTVRLDVAKCAEDPADYGICAADCGLCDTLFFEPVLNGGGSAGNRGATSGGGESDGRTSGKGFMGGYSDGYFKYNLTAGIGMSVAERAAYSGIYRKLPTVQTESSLITDAGGVSHSLAQTCFLTAAFRWGDFFHIEGANMPKTSGRASGEFDDDIITIHCPCYIYPSFTKTVQPMANTDFSFEMSDGGTTTVTGRWNTSYFADKLTSDAGSLCSPECSFLFVYYPCGCESTLVVNTLEKNQTSLIGKMFVNTAVSFDYDLADLGAFGDVKLEGARNVTNEAADAEDSRFDGLVAAAKAAEGGNLLWYNVFKVSEWDYIKDVAKTTTLEGILPVQLRFELDYDKVSADVDVNTAGWREKVWGDGATGAFTLKARNIDGTVNDIMSDLVDGKAALDKQTFVTVLADDELKTTGHVAWTKLRVFLTAFVVDAPSPDGKAFHYYKVDETGNYVLFVFDGKHDDVYEDMLYIAKPSSTCTFNVSGATTFLVGSATTLTANCLGGCADILWTLSSDVAEISGDATGASVVVEGLAAGTATIHVDSCTNSADVVLTVTTPTLTPTPTTGGGGSSSGGCSAGAFAPLALLLVAPVVLLLKK